MKSASPTGDERRSYVPSHQKPNTCSQKEIAMKALKHVVYKTADEIDQYAMRRKAEAMSLAPGEARQSILREVAQMKQYALMKRVMQPQRPH
jgi:hypothetical protein